MQWNAARLRPRINFNLHHHGTSFTWHPDGDICNDLRPIVWVSVSIQPLQGLTLSIGALRHFTLNCKARKPVVHSFLQSWKYCLWWYFTVILSLSTRCSCYSWWDRVFECHCIRFLLRWLLWGLLLLVLTVATSFALATVAPRGTVSVRLWLLASVRALRCLGCNLRMTNSFEMINTLALIASFPIRGAVASLMRFATFTTTLAIITTATGPSFRQCMSR